MNAQEFIFKTALLAQALKSGASEPPAYGVTYRSQDVVDLVDHILGNSMDALKQDQPSSVPLAALRSSEIAGMHPYPHAQTDYAKGKALKKLEQKYDQLSAERKAEKTEGAGFLQQD